jgi:hypothetical protein
VRVCHHFSRSERRDNTRLGHRMQRVPSSSGISNNDAFRSGCVARALLPLVVASGYEVRELCQTTHQLLFMVRRSAGRIWVSFVTWCRVVLSCVRECHDIYRILWSCVQDSLREIEPSRAFRGTRKVPRTCENTIHGDPTARRTSARRTLELPCAVFSMNEAPPGAPGRPRKARFKAETLLSNAAYAFIGVAATWSRLGRTRVQCWCPRRGAPTGVAREIEFLWTNMRSET